MTYFVSVAQDDGDVTIHSDPRLSIVLRAVYTELTLPEPPPRLTESSKPTPAALPATGTLPHVVYTGRGYRVQIYNGPDRNKAMAVKQAFMRRYPGIRTYIMYIAPGFRVKVGDFRSRAEAEAILRDANTINRPSMIVPDMVTVTSY